MYYLLQKSHFLFNHSILRCPARTCHSASPSDSVLLRRLCCVQEECREIEVCSRESGQKVPRSVGNQLVICSSQWQWPSPFIHERLPRCRALLVAPLHLWIFSQFSGVFTQCGLVVLKQASGLWRNAAATAAAGRRRDAYWNGADKAAA